MSIIVVDSIMGSGKSTWVRNYMNSHPEKRWWYLAVYLKEANVPLNECPKLCFREPSDETTSKGKDLISLIRQGENIASTHQLFLRIKQDPELLELIKSKGYTLVIDEVLDVVNDTSKSKDDIDAQLQAGTFSIDPDTSLLTWLNHDYSGEGFLDIKQQTSTHNIYFNGQTLISLFRPDIFAVFEEVYVLTYQFVGSRMRMYFDFYSLEYQTKHIFDGELSDKSPDNASEKRRIADLIDIYEGRLYDIGTRKYRSTSLSQRWYDDRRHTKEQNLLFNNTYNYLHNFMHARSSVTMYTVFKNVCRRRDTVLRSYKKAFVECSAKATNSYRDRYVLAYLVNMFQDPQIANFFTQHKVVLDGDAYARGSMLQWIWRSAIRDGRPIRLFIPSPRMRTLLREWLAESD